MSFDSTRFQPTTIMDSVSIPKNEQRFRRDLKRKLVTCNHFIQENPPQSFCAQHARENMNLTMKRITGIVTVALNNQLGFLQKELKSVAITHPNLLTVQRMELIIFVNL